VIEHAFEKLVQPAASGSRSSIRRSSQELRLIGTDLLDAALGVFAADAHLEHRRAGTSARGVDDRIDGY
jgi:hypothetical protein